MKAEDLIRQVVTGNYTDAELADINSAVRSALDISRQRNAAVMKATLKAGDSVVLSGLSPKSLNGLVATVVEVKKSRVRVDMPSDFRAGRFSGSKGVGVPLNCVTLQ